MIHTPPSYSIKSGPQDRGGQWKEYVGWVLNVRRSDDLGVDDPYIIHSKDPTVNILGCRV